MKVPSFQLPSVSLPLKGMPALKINLADLTRAHRSWGSVVPRAGADVAGTLEEVTSFGANPGGLKMRRFVPPGLLPGAPLVVVLHGCTQTAAGYDKGTGWSTLAARHGFTVIYPEQQRANNGNCCFNWFESGDITRGTGEAASISNMVAATMASLQCDPARVFVTGLSAGGAMTAVMLATYPDVFAAGAIVAGLPYGCAHSTQDALGAMFHPTVRPAGQRGAAVRDASPAPQRKPIVSIWHGDADTTVVPANGVELAKQWCDVHGLTERHAVTDVVDRASRRRWLDDAGTVRVELYTVPGLAHGAPITPAKPGDQGVGVPMPYVLEASISSTWHTANAWGLLAS